MASNRPPSPRGFSKRSLTPCTPTKVPHRHFVSADMPRRGRRVDSQRCFQTRGGTASRTPCFSCVQHAPKCICKSTVRICPRCTEDRKFALHIHSNRRNVSDIYVVCSAQQADRISVSRIYGTCASVWVHRGSEQVTSPQCEIRYAIHPSERVKERTTCTGFARPSGAPRAGPSDTIDAGVRRKL